MITFRLGVEASHFDRRLARLHVPTLSLFDILASPTTHAHVRPFWFFNPKWLSSQIDFINDLAPPIFAGCSIALTWVVGFGLRCACPSTDVGRTGDSPSPPSPFALRLVILALDAAAQLDL